jgi:hypothetical protein
MSTFTRVLLAIAATAIQGCAPYIGTCSWIIPEAGTALEVVEARKPTAGECNCIGCQAPGRFRIEREEYTLEFWNGDRWYPELFVRSRGKDGAVLELASDDSALLTIAPHVPADASHGFEYFIRGEPLDSARIANTLTIRVEDGAGRVLGVEVVRLRVESRKDVNVESL